MFVQDAKNVNCDIELQFKYQLSNGNVYPEFIILNFSVLCFVIVGKGLVALSKLKSLRIDCNKILRLDASELSCCVQLTSINISYNHVDSLSVSFSQFPC